MNDNNQKEDEHIAEDVSNAASENTDPQVKKEEADKISGVGVNWEYLSRLNLKKSKNTEQEALEIIFRVFYIMTVDVSIPLTEFVDTNLWIFYLNVNIRKITSALRNVFGDDVMDHVGRSKEFVLHLRSRFRLDGPLVMCSGSEIQHDDPNVIDIHSMSRIFFRRGLLDPVPLVSNIYNHSGIMFQLDQPEGDITSFIMELDNRDQNCTLVLTPLPEVCRRGKYGGTHLRMDNTIYDANSRVLMKMSPDFLIYVFGLTSGLDWAYDIDRLNCHTVSSYLTTGVIGSIPNDKTPAQRISESIKLGPLDNSEKNKPVAQVSIKEMVNMLLNIRVEKRPRVNFAVGEGSGSSG